MKIGTDKRSRDFGDEPRAVRAVRAARLPLVRAEVRLAFAFLRVKRKRSYVRWGCTSVFHWAEREGYGYQHAKRLLALARALVEVPGLLWLVRSGFVPPESAVWVACLFREPKLQLTDAQKADILRRAAAMPSREFRDLAERAIEEARQGEPTIAMRILVTRETRDGFRKVRRLLARGKDGPPSEGEVLAHLVRYYREREDPSRTPPPKQPRRKPDRRRSRYRTRHSDHTVEARSDGLCELCRERRATQKIHLVPYARGGGQDPRNIVDSCSECHFWYDLGAWQLAGFEEDGRPRFEFHPERLPKAPGAEPRDAGREDGPQAGDDQAVHERAPPLYLVGAT